MDGANPALAARAKEVDRLRAENHPTVPTTIAIERATNPFLRANDPALKRAVGMAHARDADAFGEIRRRKDAF